MRTDLHSFATELGISVESIEGRGLRECEEATELEIVEVGEDGREHFLVPAAAQAWGSMKAAANTENIQLLIVSAFRSVERQAEIVRRKLAAGGRIEEILTVCAPPGFSEHHTGAPWIYQPQAFLRLKSSLSKRRPSLGSHTTPSTSASICPFLQAMHMGISMSLGIGASTMPNPAVNRTACKLRLQVPSGLRPPAAGYLERWAP